MHTLIDTHFHLDMSAFQEDREDVIARALEAGVTQMITVGCGLASCERALELAHTYAGVFAALGVHPHHAAKADSQEVEQITSMLLDPRVVAIGETGLDYFYMHSPKEIQQQVFRAFTRLSLEKGLPLVVHSRDAEEDTLEILKTEQEGRAYRGVIHCFNGSLAFAQECLELGFYISLAGMLTFSKSLKRVVKKLPLERLLVETDAPYLAPKPHRGQRNEPAYVVETAKTLGQLFELSLEEVAEITTHNARSLFGLEAVA